MLGQVIAWIIDQLHNNDVFAGLAGASIVAPVLYYLRNLPGWIWRSIKYQFSVQMVIRNNDENFEYIGEWLARQPYAQRARRTRLTSWYNAGSATWSLVPGEGRHFMFYNRRPIIVERSVSDDKGPSLMGKLSETIVFTTIGRSQRVLRSVIADAYNVKVDPSMVKVYAWRSYWELVSRKIPRPLESVILPLEQINGIIRDLTWFQNAQNWYMERGIPYKRGYLFSGAAGTGKTSVVMVLAGLFNMPIYQLNLATVKGDDSLLSAWTAVPKDCILLIEDVDVIKSSHSRKSTTTTPAGQDDAPDDKEWVTLSGLLNVLDGVLSSDGRITILTTNYPERLDEALIRPGRVDIHSKFELCKHNEMRRLFQRFYPAHAELADVFANLWFTEKSAAEIQSLFMHYPEDPRPMIKYLTGQVQSGAE